MFHPNCVHSSAGVIFIMTLVGRGRQKLAKKRTANNEMQPSVKIKVDVYDIVKLLKPWRKQCVFDTLLSKSLFFYLDALFL